MPSMLEQAIIDAASLREAALKNAEQAIIEKYAPEIKNAVENGKTNLKIPKLNISEVGMRNSKLDEKSLNDCCARDTPSSR